jgi:hypothetical protein
MGVGWGGVGGAFLWDLGGCLTDGGGFC